jgi:uncharacterized membrane protein
MHSGARLWRIALAAACLSAALPGMARADQPVVRAVFFYLPTCDHCRRVMEEFLPPVLQHFDKQLVIAFVDASTPSGSDLFYAACDQYAVPAEAQGVPLMIVGSNVLNGDVEIPQHLEEVVAQGIAAGGVAWPPIPGIESVAAQESGTVPAAQAGAGGSAATVVEIPTEGAGAAGPVAQLSGGVGTGSQVPQVKLPSVRQSWAADPAGFGIALVAMGLMLASVAVVVWGWLRHGLAGGPPAGLQAWAIPLLCAAGVIVASYLGYVESTNTRAICGPVGDCQSVQESDFAVLFGVLPVGVLGLAGYVVVLALWAWRRFGRGSWSGRFRWLLPLVVLFGVAFSIYLTYLELLVIRAVCMWCVTSALTMTFLLWCVYRGWAEPGPRWSPARGS